MEDIESYIRDYMHAYMRQLLGETVYMMLSFVFVLIGIILIVVAITDSNAILGNPTNRNKSSLNEIEYRKTRLRLRITLGAIGIVVIAYNLLGVF